MTRILALGGRARIIRKAAELGFEIVHIQKPSGFDPATVPYCDQVLLLDYQDIPLITAVVKALHDRAPLDRIVTQAEAGQLVAALLTDVLGLPGSGREVIDRMHDKLALRRLLNGIGLGPVAAEFCTSLESLRAFTAEHGAAVVKPLMGNGSLGVRLIRSTDEVDAAWHWLQALGIDTFLVEQLLDGPEFSVETFSVGGVHEVVAITGKVTGDGVVELGHVIPAPIPEAEAAQIREFVADVLSAIGLVDGPAHTEVILTSEGPRVVESHARRGGDSIPELVEIVRGVDLEKLAYEVAGGGLSLPLDTSTGDVAAAIHFIVAEPGTVEEVSGVEEAEAVPGVIRVDVSVSPGDVVHELRWSDDRCGSVMVTDVSPEAALEKARKVARSITVRTNRVPEQETATIRDLLAQVDEVLNPFEREV
ncbi:ATP-grasp domain-containing protein [Kitasatospora sp. NPDC058162]|uniref:ATP-grasp domain-containing protein n=1 Tax=Kitasatospora sp. NPDC058162 TaxID=3346362 RepID=UPI0036D7E856